MCFPRNRISWYEFFFYCLLFPYLYRAIPHVVHPNSGGRIVMCVRCHVLRHHCTHPVNEALSGILPSLSMSARHRHFEIMRRQRKTSVSLTCKGIRGWPLAGIFNEFCWFSFTWWKFLIWFYINLIFERFFWRNLKRWFLKKKEKLRNLKKNWK